MKHSKVGISSDRTKLANTRQLTRVLTYLAEVKCAYAKQIHYATGIEGSRVKDAIRWLWNYDLIYVFKTGKAGYRKAVNYYKLAGDKLK